MWGHYRERLTVPSSNFTFPLFRRIIASCSVESPRRSRAMRVPSVATRTAKGITMTCQGILIHTPGGRDVCIPLYYEIPKFHIPQPDPWLEDLTRLKTIHEIVGHLKDHALRDSLGKAIQGAAGKLALPEGVVLGDGLFKGKMPMAA